MSEAAPLEQAMQRYARAAQLAHTLPNVPVGQSPKEIIWRRNKAKLYHYLPTAPVQHAPPLLLIYALINKPYILDLRPGASLVEYLVGQGYAVYLLDWGTPGPEDKGLKFEDYVLDYIPRAAQHTLRHSGATQFSMLGYCLGGTLSTCFAATNTSLPLKNMILMAAPLDFSERGLLRSWLDPDTFDVDQLVNAYGNIPAELIDFGSKLLKPLNNFVTTYVNFWDKLHDEKATTSWLTMQKWVSDGVPFAGEAFRQWIKDFYQSNKLVQNQLVLRGQTVRLASIQASLLNIIATQDHIALPSQSRPILDLVSSEDKQELLLPGGHVGLVVGRNAHQELWPALNNWLAARS